MPGGKGLKGEWISQLSSERRCREMKLAMWRNPRIQRRLSDRNEQRSQVCNGAVVSFDRWS